MEAREYLKKRIKTEGFFHTKDMVWLSPRGEQALWTFDMKALLLDRDFLRAATEVFWSIYDRTKPIQICGLESASIPLISALVMSGEDASGIYIRKSKKKKYDMRELEGTLRDAPIVLVDDIITSGGSMEKQISVLKKFHYDVAGIFAFVHLKEIDNYEFLRSSYGIESRFVFSAADFGEGYLESTKPKLTFTEKWKFTSAKGNEFNVARRNQMFVSDNTVYLNSDDGNVYALSMASGEIYWQTKIQKKVSPISNQGGLIKRGDKVYAAAENGTLWVINDRNGEVLGKYSLAGNLYGAINPINESLLLLTGQENKNFFALAFDTAVGKIIWRETSQYRMSVVVNERKPGRVVLSDLSGHVKMLDINSITKIWEVNLVGSVMDVVSFDQTGKKIAVVTSEGMVYILRASDGSVIKEVKIDEPFLSARPIFHNGKLYFTSLHRTVYCLEVETLEKIWEFNTRGRIFGSLSIDNDKVFFGNNEGVLYVLDSKTGKWLGSYLHGDRIVSEPVLLGQGRLIFQTLSNQVVSLQY